MAYTADCVKQDDLIIRLSVSELTLMEANPFNMDSTIGTAYYNVHDRIREFGKCQREVFNFSGVAGVRFSTSKLFL